jgi:transcriptional antiterminator
MLKQKYKTEFALMKELVNTFDPCGFIHFGFPEDEYDCLTNHLLSSVYQNKSRDEIRSIILHEIDHHFGTPDRTILVEPYKTQFYDDLETLLNKLEKHFYKGA